jgi:tRNA(Ile)-lysidine synthase
MQPLDIVSVPVDSELEAAFQNDTSRTVELYRPLLGVWRHEIEDYCGRHALEPRVDSTNVDQAYRRNRVRHDLIPYLQRHYSLAIKEHLFRLSLIARSEDELVAVLTGDLWGKLAQVESSGRSVVFDIAEFASQPEALRRRLARRALQLVAGTLADFSFAHIEAAVAIMSGEAGSPSALDLPHGVRVERTPGKSRVSGRDDEWSEHRAAACGRPLAADAPIGVVPGSTVALEEGWTLETAVAGAPAESAQAGDWCALYDYDALVQLGPLVLRRRAPGDYIRPLGMSGRRSLQDLIVDAKIPRGCRPYLAVLAPEGSQDVLWVPGPGGRRSGYAPLTRDTRRVLEMRFVKQD